MYYYLEHLELRTCTTVLVRRSLPREREREKNKRFQGTCGDSVYYCTTLLSTFKREHVRYKYKLSHMHGKANFYSDKMRTYATNSFRFPMLVYNYSPTPYFYVFLNPFLTSLLLFVCLLFSPLADQL